MSIGPGVVGGVLPGQYGVGGVVGQSGFAQQGFVGQTGFAQPGLVQPGLVQPGFVQPGVVGGVTTTEVTTFNTPVVGGGVGVVPTGIAGSTVLNPGLVGGSVVGAPYGGVATTNQFYPGYGY